jgi:hypothetical protein
VGGSGVLAATINGCVFAETANTLAGQTDVNGGCGSVSATPEPGSAALAALGCLLGALYMHRRRVTVTSSLRSTNSSVTQRPEWLALH